MVTFENFIDVTIVWRVSSLTHGPYGHERVIGLICSFLWDLIEENPNPNPNPNPYPNPTRQRSLHVVVLTPIRALMAWVYKICMGLSEP